VTIYLSLFVSLAGLLTYALADGKASEAGKIAYFSGLLAFLLQAAPHVLSTLR